MSLQKQRLLCFCPASIGGIAQYAHEQAKAVCSLEIEVTLLCPVDYPYEAEGYRQLRILSQKSKRNASRIVNQISMAIGILRDMTALDRTISATNFQCVLFASYSEYLAPLWAWRFRRHTKHDVVFGSIIHDPVRDYVVGPQWWHRWSVAEGYSFLHCAFLHEAVDLDGLPEGLELPTTVVPHGPFPAVEATLTATEARRKYTLPQDAFIMIAFGYIRDTKNLDLVIRAMADVPEAHLLVAGSESTDGQRPVIFYQNLAEETGVADRCFWINRFIDSTEVGDLFEASDIALLTYSKSFRSASGVLNTAVSCRKPCIASSGQGNLSTTVKKYSLGIWVEADDIASLRTGLKRCQSDPPTPDWEAYEKDQSWKRNGELIASSLKIRPISL
jgi:glycosyltransferase involved in cell wall biosynthesis